MKNKILFVLSLLFGLMFFNSGLNKFTNHMPMGEMPEKVGAAFGALAQLEWLFPLIGIVEIIAGILVVVPKTRALAAVMLVPIMVGIVLFHAFAGGGIVIQLVMAAILAWIIIENKDKYTPMIS